MKLGSAMARRVVLACIVVCSLALAACSTSSPTPLTDEQKANRAYMSQVNEIMAELNEGLDSFIDAVSRGDVVNMRTQADNAYKALDELTALEAPETLADVHKSYVEGSQKLKEALDAYVNLYAEAEQKGDNFDWDAYDSRIKEIQALYDAGVEALEKGDKSAAEA